jgi:hypothetical protein
VPSVTALVETVIAVPLSWWIALRTDWVLPLLIGVAVAPFALLRSEQSAALGVTWLLSWENASNVKTYRDLEARQKRVVWTIVWLLAVMSFSVAYFYAYASKSIFVGLLIWPVTFFFPVRFAQAIFAAVTPSKVSRRFSLHVC